MKTIKIEIGTIGWSVGLNMACKKIPTKIVLHGYAENGAPIYFSGGIKIIGSLSDTVFFNRADCAAYIAAGGAK